LTGCEIDNAGIIYKFDAISEKTLPNKSKNENDGEEEKKEWFYTI
jgi:hypothetical protein